MKRCEIIVTSTGRDPITTRQLQVTKLPDGTPGLCVGIPTGIEPLIIPLDEVRAVDVRIFEA